MVRKKVPDWLNSSVWSTPTPPPPPATSTSSSASVADDHLPRYPSSTITTAAESPIEPPVPASLTRESPPPPPKPEIKDKYSRTSKISNDISSSNSTSEINDEDGNDDDSSSISSPSAEDISRQAQLMTELSRKVINMRELRRIALQGIPDVAGIRSTVWKLLLGYLPPERAVWSSELAKKRSQYKHFKEELLMNPLV